MSREGGGPGGCLVTILIILVIGAAFGLVEWDTVGKFARFLVFLFIAGVVLVGGFILWSIFSGKNK